MDDFEFVKEKIKERPLNKKKLLRRTMITASMAALFGLVACLTFLLLEPLISNWLYPEKAPKTVEFPEDTEEMLPEDMLMADEPETDIPLAEDDRMDIAMKWEPGVDDYRMMYDKLYGAAKEASKSIVTVTGVTSDIDWFDDTFENKGRTSGVIVADNGREYFIVTDSASVENVESIHATFADGTQTAAELKKADAVTGLAVITVKAGQLPQTTRENVTVAALGSSNTANLVGTPVMALGSPLGTSQSVLYGAVTSAGTPLNMVDSFYKLLTTDMYASRNASGVLVNMQGKVIGIINMRHNKDDMTNLLSAIGISELKKTIELLSNARDRIYLGIYGTDVTAEIRNTLRVPVGAYVTSIEMDSPAMQVGIQSGDVIVQMDDTEITSYREYITALNKLTPDSPVMLTVKRQGADGYREVSIEVTPTVLQ